MTHGGTAEMLEVSPYKLMGQHEMRDKFKDGWQHSGLVMG